MVGQCTTGQWPPIRIDEDPLMAVTRGLIRILEDRARFADLILNSEYQPALAV